MDRIPVAKRFAFRGGTGHRSIVYWGTGLPVQYTYFAINGFLLLLSLKILGWKFSVKTIFAVFVLTFFLSVIQQLTAGLQLLQDQPFMACILGAIFCGGGIGVAFASNGSTGGTDIVAAIVNKYRDVSLGRMVMLCDMIIIASSLFCAARFGEGGLWLCNLVCYRIYDRPGGQQLSSVGPVLYYFHHPDHFRASDFRDSGNRRDLQWAGGRRQQS